MHGRNKKMFVKNLNRRYHFRDPCINERIIMKHFTETGCGLDSSHPYIGSLGKIL
jgi:hypothetical protein